MHCTTRRLAASIAATILFAVPGQALAANCAPFLVAPTDAETAAGPDAFSFSMVTTSRLGQASYSSGKAAYRGVLTVSTPGLPSIPRPPLWRTPSGSPADHLMDLQSDLLKRPNPDAFRQFQGVDIQVVPGIKAKVSVKFIGTGVVAQFEGVCSTGGVIHGTTPTIDFLIYLRRPLRANP